MQKWYQELFSNYSKKYESESFVQGTTGEVDFIEKEINQNMETKILDIDCGTGRHAIELAKRGYNVTGVDLSENMLNKAQKMPLWLVLKLILYQPMPVIYPSRKNLIW